jgi:nitrogen fixation NifU-like protein
MSSASGYDELIMEHIRNARGYRVLDDATAHANGANPLCGDEMKVYVRIVDDRIEALSFQCSCCGISMASASMMSEYLQGRHRDEAKAMADSLSAAIIAHAESPATHGDTVQHALLKIVRDLPARTPCAALPWVTLIAALDGRTDTVSVQV